jgi:WD40 repeat protein
MENMLYQEMEIICKFNLFKILIIKKNNFSLKIWSLDDARVVRSIDHTEGKITCMAFRADSQYLITGGEDCSCKLWELSSGKLTQVRKYIRN